MVDAGDRRERVTAGEGRGALVTDDGAGRRSDTGERHAPETRYEGSGIAAGVIALVVAAILVLIVVAQNLERVEFEFLWWSGRVSLAVLLLATAVAVLALDQLVGLIWRRRRRKLRELTHR